MITSKLLLSVPGIVHGFGTASELVPQVFKDAWQGKPEKKQTHGKQVAEVLQMNQECGDADGLFSAVPGIPISVITADCVPIVLARRDGKKVAAVHAGWRGLIGGIVDTLAERLKENGEDPQQWVAAVGPTIGSCCYEVSEELAAEFVAHFHTQAAEAVVPRYRHLELHAVAEAELCKIGIGEVDNLKLCTSCTRDAQGDFLFRSYRRGDRGPQLHSGAMILP
ncbi:polyphenol oxidase family protein [Undibacterium terreum]|uniref:Laccase domain protein n=1 Tax=Undibacterium terreum TaxID=1224302 RepID=A0A916U694_9BURK|nr:polyphenol oxidase family protein [Undibacterium terreum]GGC61786.1 laccase domain protein [Undibacterium terreum]